MPKRRLRPGQNRAGRPRRRRGAGCLLWIVAVILALIVLSILFGGFQKGTKVGDGRGCAVTTVKVMSTERGQALACPRLPDRSG